MKTEINNESKARFFAQYYGQDVYCNKYYSANPNPVHGTRLEFDELDNGRILLTPLSLISDEDAIEVAKRMYPKDRFPIDSELINWGKAIALEIENEPQDKDVIWFYGVINSIDYLRSKGYALPWMGLPVEQLVEAGWIQLTEV